MTLRGLAALLLALGVTGTAGCGYALVGSGRGSLPENVHSIYVGTFLNETTRVGLEQRLTEAVLRELSARARLKPVSDRQGADVELVGRLASYNAQAVRFDAAGRALEYEIVVVAKVSLLERASQKTLFEEPFFTFRQPYAIASSAAGFTDVETSAIETLARPFARSLVTTILEGF